MSALIANPTIRSIVRGVVVWSPLWISTTVLFGLLGVGYVLFLKQDSFLASQALLVRDEATGAVMRLGRFQSQAEMKAAQETILEMTKSQQVVRDALIAVGPPKSVSNWLNWGEYPSKELIEEVSKSSISVHAPKGTEFGVTEVIYVDVKAERKDEAIGLINALTDALESRLQQVRRARADGVLAELKHARDSAKRELAISTNRLHEIERNAGSDLSDLRGLTDTVASAATSRAELDQTKNDLRQAELSKQSLFADRELLVRATQDPTSFIVAPGAVLNSQPGLKRLREGLVDAQLIGSQLTGKFTEAHPSVIASQSTQSTIVKRFSQELRASISGVESDISLVEGRIRKLESQKDAAQVRLANLADNRSAYANLLSEVKSKVAILESAEKALAEIQAARDSSVSTSLLTRLDSPIVSDRPIGPGKTTIALLCSVAGLVFGLGIVFVVTPIDTTPSFGRRNADRSLGRRDADALAPTTSRVEISRSPGSAGNDSLEGTATSPDNRNTDTKIESGSAPTSDSMPEGYQPLILEHTAAAIRKASTQTDGRQITKKLGTMSTTKSVDDAFQELARLEARKPENRSEELALKMKVNEIKTFLSKEGIASSSSSISDDKPLTKPRSTRPN